MLRIIILCCCALLASGCAGGDFITTRAPDVAGSQRPNVPARSDGRATVGLVLVCSSYEALIDSVSRGTLAQVRSHRFRDLARGCQFIEPGEGREILQSGFAETKDRWVVPTLAFRYVGTGVVWHTIDPYTAYPAVRLNRRYDPRFDRTPRLGREHRLDRREKPLVRDRVRKWMRKNW